MSGLGTLTETLVFTFTMLLVNPAAPESPLPPPPPPAPVIVVAAMEETPVPVVTPEPVATPEPEVTPAPVTQHCYALPEPYKHWPIYLETTRALGTCTHNWYTARQFLEEPLHTPSIWNHVYRPAMRDLVRLADDFPGRTWLLYNEPEFAGQADTTPEDAAIHARYWVEAIGDKGKIACCGNLFFPSLGGLNWLERYLAAGGPVPDYWHIHIYAANEWEWNMVIGGWERWNAEHGNKPTIISEAGSGTDLHNFVMNEWEHPMFPAVYWFGLRELEEVLGSCVLCNVEVFLPSVGTGGE